MPIRFVESKWKGKQREVARDDGKSANSGPDGVVIPLKYLGTSQYDAAYVIPVNIGSNSQTLNLQVDTGSSDLWVVSNKCSSCSGPSYNPSTSTSSKPAQSDIQISYVSGTVGGPIYWDTVNIGGYAIQHQAFAAAETVASEPLSVYAGVFGLALPDNSVIAHTILPTTSNNPDGAPFTSNVFSIPLAPLQSFVSLTLERPGSSHVPSTLGFGKHPPKGSVILPDSLGGSSAVLGGDSLQYGKVLASSTQSGDLHWKIGVDAISVWVDGKENVVTLAKEFATAGESPTSGLSAILDSGAPAVVTDDGTAASIYAPFGVSPAKDGMYYVSCSLPLNISITIGGQQYPLHPLDLSVPPSSNTKSDQCLGLVQPMTSQLSKAGVSDMVLGIPFLRSVYFVMSYYNPTSKGNTNLNDKLNINGPVDPHIGLQRLVDPQVALDEFHRVRIQNSPLDVPTPPITTPHDAVTTKKTLKIGMWVLVGVGAFVALCTLLFLFRYFYAKKKYGQGGDVPFAPIAGDEEEANVPQRRGSEKSVVSGLKRLGGKMVTVARSATTSTRRSGRSGISASNSATEEPKLYDPPVITPGIGTRRSNKSKTGKTGRSRVMNRGDSMMQYKIPEYEEFGIKPDQAVRKKSFEESLARKERSLAALENPFLSPIPTMHSVSSRRTGNTSDNSMTPLLR